MARPISSDEGGTPARPAARKRSTARRIRRPRDTPSAPSPVDPRPSPLAAGFTVLAPERPPSILRRLLVTHRHLAGLIAGAVVDRARTPTKRGTRRGMLWRASAAILRPLLRRDLRDQPFPVQFRRRLELLGPTYIKLGQILSLREDLLPIALTDELKNLLDRLPVIPFPLFVRRVEESLGRPVDTMFAHVSPEPLGSASIAEIHRARTLDGDEVVLKVVKPAVRETLQRDAILLRLLGAGLQLLFPRYQPSRIIDEFCDYTLREVDLRREADNAETFAANFADTPDIVFPAIRREYSSDSVLCMEYLDGLRPDTPEARALPAERRERLVDLGAQAIIRMLYQDGVFHADLHPGNLIVLPGDDGEPGGRAGFIDLGMVGRFDTELKRTMLFYYYALVTGDPESAARYLAAVAIPGPHGDVNGFRREVAEIAGRWRLASTFEGFSLARLIMESLTRGARYGMYFPVEMVLMVKALITFEGVGHILLPGFDVAELSRRHIRRIFIHQFSPFHVLTEGVRSAPDLLDAVVKVPLLVTEGLRVLDRATRQRTQNPFAGLRGTLIAGFCLVDAAILLAFGTPWPVWGGLFAVALLLAVRRGE